MVVRVCTFRFTGTCMDASRMEPGSSYRHFHDVLSVAFSRLIVGFLWHVTGSWRGCFRAVSRLPVCCNQAHVGGPLHLVHARSCVVSKTGSSALLCVESWVWYSRVSLVKETKRCVCGITRWQPGFPWPLWFLQTFPQLQVTIPGAVVFTKSVYMSLASTPSRKTLWISFVW